MAADRRVVRVSPAFFVQLDERFGSARGEAGQPSTTDFLVIDLPAIVERFATDFDGLPEFIEGVGVARVLSPPDGSFVPLPCTAFLSPTTRLS